MPLAALAAGRVLALMGKLVGTTRMALAAAAAAAAGVVGIVVGALGIAAVAAAAAVGIDHRAALAQAVEVVALMGTRQLKILLCFAVRWVDTGRVLLDVTAVGTGRPVGERDRRRVAVWAEVVADRIVADAVAVGGIVAEMVADYTGPAPTGWVAVAAEAGRPSRLSDSSTSMSAG